MSARSLALAMVRRRGSRVDDRLLRAIGAMALLGIVWSLLNPTVAAFTPLVLYTLWANGPHSPVLQGAYEPVLLLYGQLFSPLLVAAVGTAAIVLIESVNYRVYGKARDTRALRNLTGRRSVQHVTRMFARTPFLAIVICAIGIVPYWIARCLSVLSDYPLGRHLAATAVGRFARLWVIAALGAPLALPRSVLLGAMVLSLVIATALWLLGRRASLMSQSA